VRIRRHFAFCRRRGASSGRPRRGAGLKLPCGRREQVPSLEFGLLRFCFCDFNGFNANAFHGFGRNRTVSNIGVICYVFCVAHSKPRSGVIT
jgi:hypothetical protein